jgi:cytochrome c oxidase subunit 3
VAAASAVGAPLHQAVNRPNITSIGTIVWLSSELMFFAGLFAIFFTLAAIHPEQFDAGQSMLNIPFSVVNTIVLVSSSVTCQFGVFAAERLQPSRTGALWQFWLWGMREWFTLTYLLGAIFVSGQVYEYTVLTGEGLSFGANAFASAFYLPTGFHALHVTGGLLAFLVVLGRSFAVRRFGEREATTAIVVSYYWHFVDVVWIALFVSVYFS